MYSNKLAVAIKAHGKVLREFDDKVFLPFQSEYSIFIKNKNSVRASVKVEIDGVDATEGVSLVVNPNDDIELERFIKNANLVEGNKFKFIKRTQQVAGHRGIRIDDGLVRVEFQYEKVPHQVITVTHDPWAQPQWRRISDPWGGTGNPPPQFYNVISDLLGTSTGSINSSNALYTASAAGITAPGEISHQEFSGVSNFQLEPQKHVIVLKLMGEHQGKTVSKTVTTRTSAYCTSCGHRSRSATARFCSQCGTTLHLIN